MVTHTEVAAPQSLPGTRRLERSDDPALAQAEAMNRYVDRLVARVAAARHEFTASIPCGDPAGLRILDAQRVRFRMVETGRDDWVTPRDWVEREYARVAALYAELGILERTEIHWGMGDTRFLPYARIRS